MKLTCFGGAEEVTGSNFLVESGETKILVDCGIVQGKDYVEAKTYGPFPYDAASIDVLIITHAHLDHVGRAPRLMKAGFKGKVYMTAPTKALSEAILHDSARILRVEADRHGHETLYDEQDIKAFFAHTEVLPYREEKEIAPGVFVYLRDTGHILGSASVRIREASGASLAITSDIGNSPALLLPDAEPIPDADVVLIESVYGNRANPEKERRVPMLRDTLKKAIARGGPILLPAFSIERTQLMLYEIGHLMESGELPEVPVFLDSPLAIDVTAIYRTYAKEFFNAEAQAEIAREGDLFSFPFLTVTRSRDESDTIAKVPGSKIIIAGAGMSHGGRIGRWEQEYLPEKETTLLMVGYQAPGSPGRMLQAGSPKVRIDGEWISVRAHIETLHGWSGHADRDGLLAFAKTCLPRTKTFIVGLGEPASARFLAQRIKGFLGVGALVPREGDQFTITEKGAKRA